MVHTSDVGRGRRAVIGVLACLVLVGAFAAVGSAAPPQVFVSSLDVSEDEPTAGDSIVVTPTVSYSGSGDGSFEVTQVTLEGADGTRYADESDLGTLGGGDTLDVPLRATLESSGEKRLVVHVRGIQYGSDGGLQQISHTKRPVFVSVSEPSTPTETPPRLSIDADDLTAGAESNVSVVVSNGGDDELTDLSLRLSGLGETPNQTRLDPALGAANSTAVTFRVRPSEPGTHPINATLTYDDGKRVEASETVNVAPLTSDVGVYATLAERNGSDVLRYRVTNHGNAPVEHVVASGAVADAPLPTATFRSVDAGSAETATVELNDPPAGEATITATYETGGDTRTTDETIRLDTDETGGDRGVGALFDPLALLSGGVLMTGSTLAYQTWRGRGR